MCGKILNHSQHSKDGKLKSCSNWSTANGEEHVYYSYHDDFGTIPKRASSNRPDGLQSHYESCRFEKDSYPIAVLYSKLHK